MGPAAATVRRSPPRGSAEDARPRQPAASGVRGPWGLPPGLGRDQCDPGYQRLDHFRGARAVLRRDRPDQPAAARPCAPVGPGVSRDTTSYRPEIGRSFRPIKGRGGTDMAAPFDWLPENRRIADVQILLTDGYCNWPAPGPFPLITGHRGMARGVQGPSWGTVIHIDAR